MNKQTLIYEGKAKRLWLNAPIKELYMEFKDDVTAGNGEKHAVIETKGKLNKAISSLVYKMLEHKGIATHFIRDIDDNTILVKAVEIIPLEVIVRNIGTGSFCKRYGVTDGTHFNTPIVEFCLKDDSLGDPFINEDAIAALGIADHELCAALKKAALKINEELTLIFGLGNLTLVDFKLEFGLDDEGNVLLADEVTPDTCRLWDMTTNKAMDKDIFRKNMADILDTNLTKAYTEVLKRVEISSDAQGIYSPETVVTFSGEQICSGSIQISGATITQEGHTVTTSASDGVHAEVDVED